MLVLVHTILNLIVFTIESCAVNASLRFEALVLLIQYRWRSGTPAGHINHLLPKLLLTGISGTQLMHKWFLQYKRNESMSHEG